MHSTLQTRNSASNQTKPIQASERNRPQLNPRKGLKQMAGLCLSRKSNESILINVAGHEIRVTVARISSENVRLVFEAERATVQVVREEIADQRDREAA